MELYIIVLTMAVAFGAGIADTALGMCYGTIMVPPLLMLGYDPLMVIPTVLITQFLINLIATVFHVRERNIRREDLRQGMLIAVPATVMAAVGSLAALAVPGVFLKGYIGIIVLAMGIFLLAGFRISTSGKGMVFLGVAAGFNKGFSGGGFGPIVTSGQIIMKERVRSAIGISDLSQVSVSVVGFMVYYVMEGAYMYDLFLVVLVPIVITGFTGPYLTRRIARHPKIERYLGLTVLLLGIGTIAKVAMDYM